MYMYIGVYSVAVTVLCLTRGVTCTVNVTYFEGTSKPSILHGVAERNGNI